MTKTRSPSEKRIESIIAKGTRRMWSREPQQRQAWFVDLAIDDGGGRAGFSFALLPTRRIKRVMDAKARWLIENAFNRLKDFRRIATRFARLARNYMASICLATAIVWWI